MQKNNMFGKTDLAKQILQQENMRGLVGKSQGDAFKPWKNQNTKIQETPFGNLNTNKPNKVFKPIDKMERNNASNSIFEVQASTNILLDMRKKQIEQKAKFGGIK